MNWWQNVPTFLSEHLSLMLKSGAWYFVWVLDFQPGIPKLSVGLLTSTPHPPHKVGGKRRAQFFCQVGKQGRPIAHGKLVFPSMYGGMLRQM